MHLIEQNILDVHCSSQAFGKTLHDHLSWVMERQVYPKLENLLDQYDVANYTWCIDQLHLNLLDIKKENWEEELVKMTLLQIEEYLKNNRPQGNWHASDEVTSSQLLSKQHQALELFFYYLKTGILPTNTIAKKIDDVVALIEVNADFIIQFRLFLDENPHSVLRFVLTASLQFRTEIIQKISSKPTFITIMDEVLKVAVNYFKKENSVLKQLVNDAITKQQWIDFLVLTYQLQTISPQKSVFLQQFVAHSSRWNMTTTEIRTIFVVLEEQLKKSFKSLPTEELIFIKEIKNSSQSISNSLKFDQKEESLSNPKEALISDFHFVENAGLVLLHPFFQPLFSQLHLITPTNEWNNQNCQDKAVLLMQYLVTGTTTFSENELLLNKIFCGLDLTDEVNTQLEITNQEKEKCQSLLAAVLEHWSVMNNSSVEALRGTFLLRNGKLSFADSNTIELQVENKGVDILLGQLPWGISYVKTLWMERYLTCDWS